MDVDQVADEQLSGAWRAAEDAARRAPSVCGTRPWTVAVRGSRMRVGTDDDRRLAGADPGGRELVLSCGAAVFNARLALRASGVVHRVALLPDPSSPGLLAEIAASPPERGTAGAAPGDGDLRLFRALPLRRTHRGPFLTDIDDVAAVRALIAAAAGEGARLEPVTGPGRIRALAGLVSAAELLQREDDQRCAELASWVRGPSDLRPDGVNAADFPADGGAGAAAAGFPGRDYGASGRTGILPVRGDATGTVALLSTPGDDRADWLAAGHALQRVLLTAAAEGIAAAFHTQPLEEPHLRRFIAEGFCDGAHPQMLLRLGRLLPYGTQPAAP